ncbi:Carbonyl reductase [NADPH] 1 [Tetrabaena socialis]|uniref:Carbonyl reductase [NADPH] 1 n=1 Tax=Tetrabaena socialis TaxID=47790 RepID=A0A2J8A2S9_9CHLO|nr:Carbonyl reductase [NADPH] 1 [Tetrabaena socialis]|eukprot:PNH06827.1 Carbonyl reductase [NADPH] 1 [Tetrabaena socialis]
MALYTGDKWWDDKTVAVVTGSNKGIGFEAARMLAEQGLTTVVTSRNEEQGKQAAAKIQAAAPASRVLYHQLDIADPASVDRFASWLREELGGVTVLVNNAGFAYKGNVFGADEAKVTLGINYAGTRALTEKLLPLLKGPARIVNVSSRAGTRSIVRSQQLLERLTSAASPQQLDEAAEEFVSAIRAGDHAAKGWPSSMYGISKLLLSLWTAQLAEQLRGKHVMVNAMCPGWCRTDMSSGGGTKSAADGADTAVWLALRNPDDFATGGFWGERGGIPW